MSRPDRAAVDRVAYAIAKVIAKKTVRESIGLRRLDALGKASAEHTLAQRMVPDLREEAEAAWIEANRIAVEVPA